MLSPFRGFLDVRSELDRMFDEVLGNWPRGAARREDVAGWSPVIDAFSRNGDLVIRAELPGVKREDVDITLSNGVLTISGERKAEHEDQGSGYYVRERRHGHFRRSMSLPEGIEEDKVHAHFEDGVLEVTVEGAAAVTGPKRIQIEGAGGGSEG
jgi:HSP20 family protein